MIAHDEMLDMIATEAVESIDADPCNHIYLIERIRAILPEFKHSSELPAPTSQKGAPQCQ